MEESLTSLLAQSQTGNQQLMSQVYERFYQEIKQLALYQVNKLSPNSTISPTVLMHECYLKMIDGVPTKYQNSKHFYACLGKSMRHFLIDVFRSKQTQKRQSQQQFHGLTHVIGDSDIQFELMDLERIFKQIDKINPRLAELLELKLFVGLQVPQIADLYQCSVRKVINDWNHTKALILALSEEQEG